MQFKCSGFDFSSSNAGTVSPYKQWVTDLVVRRWIWSQLCTGLPMSISTFTWLLTVLMASASMRRWISCSATASTAAVMFTSKFLVLSPQALIVTFSHWVPHWAPKSVTNSYLGSIPVTNELHQVSKGSKGHLISGGDSSCSWVLVWALDPVFERSCRLYCWVRRWNVDGEPEDSNTFTVDVRIVFPGGTRSLWRIQTLSLSTAFYCCSGTGWLYSVRRWCQCSSKHS